MQIWAESGKSALPICNYSQILYQFLTFTQNLKRSPIRQCRKDSRNQYLTTDADGHLCYYHTLISVSTQEVQAVVRLSLKAKSLETLKTNHNSSHEKTGKDFMF